MKFTQAFLAALFASITATYASPVPAPGRNKDYALTEASADVVVEDTQYGEVYDKHHYKNPFCDIKSGFKCLKHHLKDAGKDVKYDFKEWKHRVHNSWEELKLKLHADIEVFDYEMSRVAHKIVGVIERIGVDVFIGIEAAVAIPIIATEWLVEDVLYHAAWVFYEIGHLEHKAARHIKHAFKHMERDVREFLLSELVIIAGLFQPGYVCEEERVEVVLADVMEFSQNTELVANVQTYHAVEYQQHITNVFQTIVAHKETLTFQDPISGTVITEVSETQEQQTVAQTEDYTYQEQDQSSYPVYQGYDQGYSGWN